MSERERFFGLLPFLVNGTLHADDREFMRRYLIACPELHAQVRFHKALRKRLHRSMQHALAGVPPTVGYARALSLIAKDYPPRRDPKPRPRWFGVPTALAAGLLLGWASMFAILRPTKEPSRVRSPTPIAPDPSMALLRVNLDPPISERHIHMEEVHATVVTGITKL